LCPALCSTSARAAAVGTITEHPVPALMSEPAGIARGPDGNAWFTEHLGNQIGRITVAGSIAQLEIPIASSRPVGIAAGPDGNMWFTQALGDEIGRVTVASGADLSVALSASPNPVISRGPLTYTLTMANGGPQHATRVTVADELPDTHYGWVSSTQGICIRSTGTNIRPGAGRSHAIPVGSRQAPARRSRPESPPRSRER
jgi:uncharacterized repeat protein (TIGR01451 family)